MSRKKLGVIGGMGPMATADYYKKVIQHTKAGSDQDHIDMVILSHASMPDRTETIMTGESRELLEFMRADIGILESAGVANIAIPCNTSHYYMRELVAMTQTNIINMVAETILEARRRYGQGAKIAILATEGTVRTGVYTDECRDQGICYLTPNEELQRQITDIIYRDVKGNNNLDASKLANIVRHYTGIEQCAGVILACTELSCIQLPDDLKDYYIDAMDVLVRQSIILSDREYIE